MNCYGLLELSEAVTFEAVSPVTSVFYDANNKQVFSVRSGGATGIVVKSASKAQKTFVLEDKGPILSIKLSPNQQIVSIQRNPASLDLHNFNADGQIEPQEYCLVSKNKNSPIHSYVWIGSSNDILIITDVSLDLYSVVPSKKVVKYLRSSNSTVSWVVCCTDSYIAVTSAKVEASHLQVWTYKNSTIVKLPGIDLGDKLVKEKDVSILTFYNKCYISITDRQDETIKGLRLYTTDNEQIAFTHRLNFDAGSSPIGIQVVDNLILVHTQHTSCTHVFDVAVNGTSIMKEGAFHEHNPVVDRTVLAKKNKTCGNSDFGGNNVEYSPTWVVFLPNIIVDARQGQMFTVNLKLKKAVSSNAVTMCSFLLHRNAGKQHLLNHLKSCLQDDNVTLHQFSVMFQEIWRAYCAHQNPSEPATLYTGLVGCYGKLDVNPAVDVTPSVVIDQSELYTVVLVPAQQTVELTRIQAVIVELLLSLAMVKLKPRQFILEMFINLAVKTQQYYQMHQYVQYGVITDSKHIACIILSLESVYPPARQIALDMMSRLGDAAEELIEICLADGKVVQAINLARETGLQDTISARKYLEAARNLTPSTYFNVFSFFEERNVRLRGNPRFPPEDNCHEFVQLFKTLHLSIEEQQKSQENK